MTAQNGWRLPPPIDDPMLDTVPDPGERWPVNPAVRDWVVDEDDVELGIWRPDDIGWPRMGLTRLQVAGLWFAAAVGAGLGLLWVWLKGARP